MANADFRMYAWETGTNACKTNQSYYFFKEHRNIATKSLAKDYFGLKCILSYYVSFQTMISPYDANCVTPLIYPTTDLDFLFGIIVSFDFDFLFLFFFFETCTLPFFVNKRHYPVIVIS